MATIYLDHAAATPVDPRVVTALLPYLTEQFYNPSAIYRAGRQARAAVDTARSAVAARLGSRPAEIIFTAGGSEANNLAISGIMSRYPQANLVTSAIEHDSVIQISQMFQQQIAPVDDQGLLDLNRLQAIINDKTVLVSVMYANNEIGVVQPIRRIGQLIDTIKSDRHQRKVIMPLFLHVDAAQAANYLDIHVARLGIDLMSLNGGKIYGPKQSGALYVRAGIELEPLIRGGGQESGLRSGTENVPGIVGFAAALGLAQDMRSAESGRLSQLQQYFFNELQRRFPDVTVNGSTKYRLPNNLHFTIPGQDNERLLFELDEAGIMAAAGSACSASHETASHVLAALGLDEASARASLRLTMGQSTTKHQLELVLDKLQQLILRP